MKNLVYGVLGLVAGCMIVNAWASRNSVGTYSLPNADVVTGNPISSSWANTTLHDIQTEFTDSLSRSGKGGMTAQLQCIDGPDVSHPGITFATETSSGLRRVSAGNICLTVLGGDAICSTTATTTFPGSATRGNLSLTPIALPSAPSNGDIWVETPANVAKARINSVTKTILTSPIARTDLATVGQQTSASSSNFSNGGSALVDVTNLAVTITTTGRPVIVSVQDDGDNTHLASFGLNANAFVTIDRGGTNIAVYQATTALPLSSGGFTYLDAVGAGTYTYKIRVNPGGTAFTVNYMKLVAYEL